MNAGDTQELFRKHFLHLHSIQGPAVRDVMRKKVLETVASVAKNERVVGHIEETRSEMWS